MTNKQLRKHRFIFAHQQWNQNGIGVKTPSLQQIMAYFKYLISRGRK